MRASGVFALGAIMGDEFVQDAKENVSDALRAGKRRA